MTDDAKKDCTVQSLIWDGRTVFVETWPRYYYVAGLTKPTCHARYKIGDEVQMKLHSMDGPSVIERMQVTQFRWAPPEVIYHLANGRMARDWQVW